MAAFQQNKLVKLMKEKYVRPVIGQECICPDGLGRVVAWEDRFPKNWIQVDTYVKNRSCKWDRHNVKLIPIAGLADET